MATSRKRNGGRRSSGLELLDKSLEALPVIHRGAIGELYSYAIGVAAPYDAPDISVNEGGLKYHPDTGILRNLLRRFQVAAAQTDVLDPSQGSDTRLRFPHQYGGEKRVSRLYWDVSGQHGRFACVP